MELNNRTTSTPIVPEVVDDTAQYFDGVKTWEDVGQAVGKADRHAWKEKFLEHERFSNKNGLGLKDTIKTLAEGSQDIDVAIELVAGLYKQYRDNADLKKGHEKTAPLEYFLWSAEGCLPAEKLQRALARAALLEKVPDAGEKFDEKTDRGKRLENLEASLKRRAARVVRLGIEAIDNLLNMGEGIYPGEILHIVGGEGGGKTTLLLNALMDYARQEGRSLFFSLDMGPEAIDTRMLQREMNTSRGQVHNHIRGDSPWYQEAKERIKGQYDPYLKTMGGPLSLPQMEAAILASEADVIALDYVTLVEVTNPQGFPASELQTAKEVSKAARHWAHDWGLTVILLSQMSRESSRDAKKGGTGGHGMGGSSLEQLADYELELFRDAPSGNEEPPVICTITKNRNGRGKGKSFKIFNTGASMEFTNKAEEVEKTGGRKPVFSNANLKDILGGRP